jgi:hypothetical protein
MLSNHKFLYFIQNQRLISSLCIDYKSVHHDCFMSPVCLTKNYKKQTKIPPFILDGIKRFLP